jgi:uncharacterized membrane protein YqhA
VKEEFEKDLDFKLLHSIVYISYDVLFQLFINIRKTTEKSRANTTQQTPLRKNLFFIYFLKPLIDNFLFLFFLTF